MNAFKRSLTGIVSTIIFLGLNTSAYSQTAGSLTFSCSTYAPSGTWGNKHVLAIWIENTQNPSKFVKTKAKYGHQDDHLTSWTTMTNSNLVDAVTGATLTSYGTQSILWDGTDVNSTVVPDGDYNVYIEMGWGKDKVNQHAVMPFTFTKGASTVQLTPTGSSNYSNVSIEWKPTVTLANDVKDNNSVLVYPNPSKGKVRLDFKSNMQSAKVSVENTSGVSVYNNTLKNGFTGILDIDLTSFANGLYFVKISSPEDQYVYKVVLNK